MDTILLFRTTSLECWRLKFLGIRRFAQAHGWHLQTIDCTSTEVNLKELLAYWKPNGCIIESNGSPGPFPARSLRTVPSVFIDHPPDTHNEGITIVRHDSAGIARMAAQELLRLDYPNAAILGWRTQSYWQDDKFQAFGDIVTRNGTRLFTHRIPRSLANSPLELQQELCRWVQRLPRPCGIFGVYDQLALAVLNAATASGLSVPDDVAIIGADDDEMTCETALPSMSSVRPDFQTSGYRAAELLQNRLDDPSLPPQLLSIPPLRVERRQSTQKKGITDSQVKNALERIRREATAGITAAEVLSHFTVSRRRAEVRFRKMVGHTILEEIQRVRYEAALDVLHETNTPIGLVAERSGWPSPLVLSRYVKSKTGLTLSELRRNGSEASRKNKALRA